MSRTKRFDVKNIKLGGQNITYKSAKTDDGGDRQEKHEEFHLRFRSTSFFQFASTCAAQTEMEETEVSMTPLPPPDCRQTNPAREGLSYRRSFCLRFPVSDGKFEILPVVSLAVVTIAVSKLAFQGLGDQGGSIHRLTGLYFNFTFSRVTVEHS